MLELLGLRLGKGAIIALTLAVLVAAGGLGFWRGLAAINAMVARADATATAARDAHWRAQIAASNAQVEHELRQRAEATIAAEAAATAEIARLQKSLTDLEAANAALPNGAACGVDRDRVRLLNR